ncbi:MAG TPA: response regulator [Polyangiaceae bacterium]|jgi:CheY-like chemotaxis protein|nr:response regulator [Polyangiaceae bacterium]
MVDKPLIVVIDDSEVILQRIKTRLEIEGYKVVTSAQTVGAARLLKGASLVIIDWHMPGISGGEVLGSFRAACANSPKRPVFYLYTSDPGVSGVAKNAGFDGSFVNKGDDDSLVQQVAAALRIAKLKARALS